MDQTPVAAPSCRGIFVLGMHRSGTSAITRGVQALGAYLGNNFLDTRFDNPTGYWEDRGIVELNDRMLSLFGMGWEDTGLIDESWWSSSSVRLYVAEARHYLASQFMAHPLWAFKDPRTLRLLPVWRRVVELLAVEDAHLLILRNPLSVAASLYQRQSMERAAAYRLWLAYVVPQLALVFGRRLTVVDYDLFMDDPPSQLDRIARHLQIVPISAAARTAYLENFLQAEMRHLRFDETDLERTDLPAAVRDAYRWLRRLATDELGPLCPEFQAAWAEVAAAVQSMLAE